MSITESPDNGLTLVSLFSGAGGSSLGYKSAGYDIRLAVEWDAKAAEVYRRNFPGATIHEGDICALSGDEALRLAGLRDGELDVLDGSPPCQGFSMAGKRRFSDGRNRLFEEYVRLLKAFRPRALIMENVSGLVKGKMKLAFAEMTAALKGAGYRVSCRLLNAWWYGVPQDRRRLVWVGVRGDLGVAPSHPAPTAKRPATVAEALGIDGITGEWKADIKNAIHNNGWRSMDLPSPSLCASQPPTVLIEMHPGYRDAKFREGPAPTLGAGRKTRIARPKPARSWAAASPGQEVKRWQSRKLDVGREAWTQVTHPHWHPAESRYITIAEAKILQGFPESFTVDKYRLIGNSVPPPMAEAVGRHVAALLRGADGYGG